MNIIAFAASSSKYSINKQLVTHAAQVVKTDIDTSAVIDVLDLNDYEMPIYSIDRENESGIPELAHQFYNKIGNADAVIISFAAHNGSYAAAYKNIFDWISRINSKVFQGKKMVLLSTSPGPNGAKIVLDTACESAPHFNADLRGRLSIPSFHTHFDSETQKLQSSEYAAQLTAELQKLA